MKKLKYLMLIVFFSFFFFGCQEKEEVIEQEIEEVSISNSIQIDIKGAIQNPGLYELEEGSRVQDAIRIAGGLLENADVSYINLSKKLQDEMVVIIYTKEEIHTLEEGNTAIKYIEKECVCPSIKNDGCIEETKKESNTPKETNTGMISLNHGTLEELMSLTGIGESKAKAIISYREQNGPFTDIHDITKVSGIGESTYEKIKDRLTL